MQISLQRPLATVAGKSPQERLGTVESKGTPLLRRTGSNWQTRRRPSGCRSSHIRGREKYLRTSDRKARMGRLCIQEGTRPIRYRYRTAALAGRWRDSRDEAVRDALKAHQALLDASEPDGLRWLVDGEIEEVESAQALTDRIRRH
jgi:hypothetical protein